ncbi:uncharacterized protein LOC132627594 isoform X8 [Lycium barbarum]|uniref:uncharacterized protein LOC132627594 isoform X8 n=1 Tax=Lycium barbarum TaxID=112863 RepID=UPI00293E5F3F|nr:uncharacterized protein LOC132627594 isoform X8 [Lycium barbarum]
MLLGSRCSFKSALQESQQKRKIMILKDTIRARNKYYVILRRLPICKWENKSINFLTGIVGIRNEHTMFPRVKLYVIILHVERCFSERETTWSS